MVIQRVQLNDRFLEIFWMELVLQFVRYNYYCHLLLVVKVATENILFPITLTKSIS